MTRLINDTSIKGFQQQLMDFHDELTRVQQGLRVDQDEATYKIAKELERYIVDEKIGSSSYIERYNTERSESSIRDWEVEKPGTKSGEYEVFTKTTHAKYFEYGTPSHSISGNPWLSWEPAERTSDSISEHTADGEEEASGNVKGDEVFYEIVKHPGIEAQHFLRNSVKHFDSKDKLLNELWDRTEERFNKEL